MFSWHYTETVETDAPAQITHSVTIRGLLAPLFGLLIGRGVKKHLRTAILKLADKCEL